MKTYIIYRHILNNKSYIGYTSKTLEERLSEHIEESENGSERHFHRAIRKYGIKNMISETIDTAKSRKEAKTLESHYISSYDTFKNGYNMTLGGDGGNTKEKYTKEKMSKWSSEASKRQSGMNNGNAKVDISSEKIVEATIEYIVTHNLNGKNVLKKDIYIFLKKKLNISQEIVRRRGIKNFTKLITLVNEYFDKINLNRVIYNPYYRSEEERNILAQKASEYGWVTDGVNNKQIKKTEIDEYLMENLTYRKGRTI